MTRQNFSQHKIKNCRPDGLHDVQRLLKDGADVTVWNRTRSAAEPLAADGATVVNSPADLADRDIVFTMVGSPEDFMQVTLEEDGVLMVTVNLRC